jgi:hypothetical protein
MTDRAPIEHSSRVASLGKGYSFILAALRKSTQPNRSKSNTGRAMP